MNYSAATGVAWITNQGRATTTAGRVVKALLSHESLEITTGDALVRVSLPHVQTGDGPISMEMSEPTIEAAEEDVSLDALKLRVLREVTRTPGISDTDIADRLGITGFDASFILEALAQDGLLVGAPCERE